jgi:hypothetical protein
MASNYRPTSLIKYFFEVFKFIIHDHLSYFFNHAFNLLSTLFLNLDPLQPTWLPSYRFFSQSDIKDKLIQFISM